MRPSGDWHPLARRWRERGGLVLSERFVRALERTRRRPKPRPKRRAYVPPTFAAMAIPKGDRDE